MAINKLSFGGTGNAINPLSTFGDDILKVGNSMQQQELNRLAAERADKDLKLRQQAENRAEKQYADAQAAKAAGSKYMTDMSKVLESGVISQADQEKLGTLANNAGEAYKRGDMKTYNALQGQLAELTSAGSLKAMSDAYQKNDAAKLQLLQGVTASPMMDTRDKVALLGSVADPLEKRLDADTKYGYDVKLQETANAKALELAKLQHDYRLAEQKAETKAQLDRYDKLEEAKRGNTPMYKDGVRVLYKDLTPEQIKSGEWIDNETRTARLNAGKESFEQQTKTDELNIKKAENTRKVQEEIDKLIAVSGNPGATGQIVAKMRVAKMPESGIYSALSTSTGGGPFDLLKPDYDTVRLEEQLDKFVTSGSAPGSTDKETAEAKAAAEKQIKSDQDRRKALLGAPELSEKEATELETITRRLASTDKSERRAKEQQEIDRVLGLKPSQMTKKDRDILNAYKYGYIPGTNIPASADIAGVMY